MKYCKKCQVTVIGNHKRCPLCQKELEMLSGEGKEESRGVQNTGETEDIFPQFPELYKRNLVFKIITFISCLLVIVSMFLNMLLDGQHGWAYIIVAAACCFWVTFYMAYRKRKNVEKAILYVEVLLVIICWGWDHFMGNYGWSLDFVLPGLAMLALVGLFVIKKFFLTENGDDIIYLIISSLLGMVPLLFYAIGWLHFYVPSLICALVSVIFLTAVLVFQWDRMLAEIQRRMHL